MRNLYEDVSALDRRCYDLYRLSEDILMEHAATALAAAVRRQNPRRVLVVAGPGNNGGDGVAAARQLLGEYEVELFMPYGAKSGMCRLQLERFEAAGGRLADEMGEADAIVDALFGSGLRRPLREEAVALVERLNGMGGYKIACDIPTGLDPKGAPLPVAFRADRTVTMGAPKLALYGDYAKEFVGEIEVADLGVSRPLYEEESPYKLLEPSDLRPPRRERPSVNKGDFGHLAVIAGEKEGAAIIAAKAALGYGAGLVTVVRNEPISVPYELMHAHALPPKCTALAVGMGLGMEYGDAEFAELVLGFKGPMVIDADLFYSPKILELLRRDRIVLTPHPKEFASLLRLCGVGELSVQEIQRDRFGAALLFSRRYPNAVLILKGANPIVAKGERLFVNPLGTPALAKGGSGDVLTGLVGALLAYEPLEAAIQASLAHAVASRRIGVADYGMTPTDLIEAVRRL